MKESAIGSRSHSKVLSFGFQLIARPADAGQQDPGEQHKGRCITMEAPQSHRADDDEGKIGDDVPKVRYSQQGTLVGELVSRSASTLRWFRLNRSRSNASRLSLNAYHRRCARQGYRGAGVSPLHSGWPPLIGKVPQIEGAYVNPAIASGASSTRRRPGKPWPT